MTAVEVWSAGKFPNGITPESLKHAHLSVQRNPIIAEVFHRAGLIEKWGRGTNRVAEMCRAAGVAPTGVRGDHRGGRRDVPGTGRSGGE